MDSKFYSFRHIFKAMIDKMNSLLETVTSKFGFLKWTVKNNSYLN